MPTKVEVKCKNCKSNFMARVADRKRGWGKFCSKSCKASHQERRKGQYLRYKDSVSNVGNFIIGAAMDGK